MADRLTIAYVSNGRLNVTVPELYNLDRKQLYDLVGKRLFENANRRIRNIRAKKLISESVYENRKIGMFSARGKTKEQLIDEIRRANNFLTQPDSTVKGAKLRTADMQRLHPNLTKSEMLVVYDVYKNIEANNPIYFAELAKKTGMYGDSNRLMAEIKTVVYNKRVDFPQGLSGDLLSRDKKVIRATAAERERAIEDIKAFFRAKYDKVERQIVRHSGKSLSLSYEEAMGLNSGKIEVEKI